MPDRHGFDSGHNDAPAGASGPTPDPDAIAIFLDLVFGYSNGWIAVRSFVEKGLGFDRHPRNIWIKAGDGAAGRVALFAARAAREGMGVYAIPGTVAESGRARAADVRQMQAVVVDLDSGDIGAKRDHLARHLGEPTLVVQSGGRTPEGQDKLHVWWRLTEPAEGDDLALLCRLRGDIAAKVGGDRSFRSAHQPIRIAGTVHHKGGVQRLVAIRQHCPRAEVDLYDFAEAVEAMPALPGAGMDPGASPDKPGLDAVLTTPVHEGGRDGWSRFQGASAAIGHYVRLIHDGRMTMDEGWEAICQYNAALLRPPWPLDRLRAEMDRLWRRHVDKHGPGRKRGEPPPTASLPAYSLGALLDDTSAMPEDIIAPRVLTPGGLLVLGGAPKVGKSDFLIALLVHMAAGVPFLRFVPPRPLRIFYLQAEIQYHYLRERLQGIRMNPTVLAAARDTLVATPKLRLLLDEAGVELAIAAVQEHFGDTPPDIICIDPIRNLFDGGSEDGGENNNSAMLFFLQRRVEALRDAVAPDAGLILCHHTRKITKTQLAEDPFQALSGASALRSFYTSGIIMHRLDEERPERRLEIELRNGPALPPLLVDKVDGQWVELNQNHERLVRREVGGRLDAERARKRDVILQLLDDEARQGRLFTMNQFAEAFENKAGLGGKETIQSRLNVLATKGHVKFVRDAAPYGLDPSRSRFGYLCVEGMLFPSEKEIVDDATGEIATLMPVLPTHYKSPQNGAVLEVENPQVWVYPEGEEP